MTHIQRTLLLLVAVSLTYAEIDLTKLPKKVTFPPKIIVQSDKEIAYKVGDTITGQVRLQCQAQGDPEPEYRWTKDGQPLEITGIEYKRQPGEGTLIIEDPQDSHEGTYQCFAQNEHGTAVAVRTTLRKAMLEPFDSVKEPHVHRPEIGSYLQLRCHPPKSYPRGYTYWGVTNPGDKFEPIAENDRIALDYNGHLHFTNVIMDDYVEGKNYVCIVYNDQLRGLVQGDDQQVIPEAKTGNLHFTNVAPIDARGGSTLVCVSYNPVLRGLVQGDDQKIQPNGPATPAYRPPELAWSSEINTIGLKGTKKTMKCIFKGYPTPRVSWERINGNLDVSRMDPNANFGLELQIFELDFDDAGTYRCTATNGGDGQTTSQDIELKVESMPFWVRQMENVNTAEEEDAEFECVAGGMPGPTIKWSIDGIDINELPEDPRRTLKGTHLSFRNVTKADSKVIQCNATNKHGYIFTNAYLNVLAEPPTFIKAPEPVIKKAQGQSAVISCRVFGAPNPKITWFYEGDEINDPRFTVTKDGDLEISNVMKDDKGNYECHAVNKFGQIAARGDLLVRERTVITEPPDSKAVNASTDVKFECTATTDPLEESQLKITWKRNGKAIDFPNEPRMRLNVQDNSLTIIAATVEDSADYTCVADNGLDNDSVTANLMVKDRPSPPYDVNIVGCGSSNAEIAWKIGNENNEPIIELIVYSNTSFDKEGEFKEDHRVGRSTTQTGITLSPWANYTFHVRARNSLGISDRSEFTAVCTTQPDKPYRNPNNVCTKSVAPDLLVVTWEPMDRIDHNGEGFHYIVGYKLHDIPDAQQETRRVYDWKQEQLVIEDQETFREYEIYVQAANNIGQGPESQNRLRKMIGFSGEGKPDVTPTGLKIDEGSLNATSVIFTWDPVDTSPQAMKGIFTGYEIHYWKEDDPERKDKKRHVISRKGEGFCRPLNTSPGGGDRPGPRGKREAEPESTHVMDLWPFSTINAAILARNTNNMGSLSDPPIQFTTPEGVPGKVHMFEVRERASHHLGVAWMPPLEANGILIGYTIGYRKAEDARGPIKEIPVLDPMRRSYKIKDLTDSTKYILYLWALTNVGRGEFIFIEDSTLSDGPPDVPGFADIEVGEDSLNVSWVPSEGQTKNPGSEFYVLYREVGNDEWTRSDPEDDQMHTNITGLNPGALYEIVIVAVNGEGVEERSPPKKVRVGPQEEITGPVTGSEVAIMAAAQEPQIQSIATAGWFVGMMCAIIFLLLVLLIVCLIKRNRGGKYPVHEKEKLRGRDPEKDDEEGGFGEYTKTPQSKVDEPDYKKSAGSLESETKPLGESDEDSMLEYEETDPTKFNEDGSFIGQYGGKTKKEEKTEPDATSPSALSTFV